LALILLAVSLSQTVSAQDIHVSTATFTDIGTSNFPPIAGPNDIQQTNDFGAHSTNNGLFNYEDNGFAATVLPTGDAGATFVVGSNPSGYVVTNFMFQLFPSGGAFNGSYNPAANGGASEPNNTMQPWTVNFYQVGFDPSGLGSNLTLLSSITTMPGTMTNYGDWVSISNIEVYLAPNTTNAWTISMTPGGYGYCSLPLVSNVATAGTTPIVPGVHPIIALSPTVAQGGVNPPVTYGTTSSQLFGVWMTNLNPIFSIGLASTFQPSIITTNPFSFMMFSNNLVGTGQTWTFTASGTGSTNAGHGLGGYWMANYGSGYTKTLTSDAQPTTSVIPASAGGAGAIVISSLQVVNISAGDLGSYVFVVTNSANGSTINSATSQVATLTAVTPPTNSYAAAVVNLGAVAYWPLNETTDPSTEHALAYDLIGGHTGWYGMNADSGVGNAGQGYVPISGPTSPAFVGFPATNGALGGLRGTNLATPSGSATNGYEYVCVSNAPTFTSLSPNITMAGWVWPNYNSAGKEPGGNAGIFLQRSGQFGASATSGIQVGNNNNNVGYHWDNDNSVTYNFNSGPVMPGYTWSLIALVVQQSNATLYCCSPSIGVQQVVAAGAGTNHVNEAFGAGIEIGLDMNTSPGRTWLGMLSSWAMFPTALTVTNIEQLYDAGVQGGTQTPIMAVDLTNNIQILTGVSPTVSLTAAAYGFSPTNGGTWQLSKSAGNWTSLSGNGPNNNLGGTAVATSGLSGLLSTTLTISNATPLDAASYRIIITNLWGNSVTSQVATISFLAAPAAGSYAATAISPAYGAVALWPLNETNNPNTGAAEAFDVVGGFNGFYGTNANNGGGNPADGFSPVVGPGKSGAIGLPTQGALGSLNNSSNLTYVTTAATPTLQPTGTNATIVAWLYPNNFTELASTGVFVQRSGNLGANSTAGLQYGLTNNQVGMHWDGDQANIYNYSGQFIPSNMWSMVALAVSPTNMMFYVFNTNQGVTTSSYVTNNVYVSFGGGVVIGGDPYQGGSALTNRSFGGLMSSITMFSNTLSYAQVATLFDSGLANNNQLPFITQNPLNNQLFTNFPVNATFTAGAYGGAENLTNGSFWQRNVSGTWVTLTDGINGGTPNISGSCTTNTNNLNILSTLTVSNVSTADVGSYRLIVSNSFDGLNTYYATSGVATLALITTQPPANSFAAAVLATPGVVAYWPLNETGDPSTGAVEAYDVVGGFNGLYGTYAQDGTQNSQIGAVLTSVGAPASLNYGVVPGPSSVLSGFPANNSSLGSLQNTLANTFVTTASSPTFPTNGAPGWHTNITIIAWINPQTNEPANTGLVMMRTPGGQVDGLCYGPNANALGYNWNNSDTFVRGQVLTTNQWAMVAVVITNNSSSLFVGTAGGSLSEVVNLGVSNPNQTWGGALTIGGDPIGGGVARSFGGYVSSVVIFSNALTAAQIENLYLAGYKDGVVPAPVIASQPVSTNMMLIPGISANITATAFGFPPINGYFQKWNGASWVNVANAGDISGATSLFPTLTLQQGTLVFGAINSGDAGSYQMVVTNMTGSVTSQVVSVSLIAPPAAGTFASVITNAAYGTVSYWPLNETTDPSTGSATAFDVMGGYNGVYGVNAQDGGFNSALRTAGGPNYLGPIAGPGGYGFPGLPFTGALASLQSALPNTFVTTPATPSLPGLNSAASLAVPNSTNLTLVEWIYPRTNGTAGTGLFMQRGGVFSASRTDGMFINSGPVLSAAWDNNTVYNFAGPAIPISNWSMVALVVTPASNIYYVGTNNLVNGTYVLTSATQTQANVNEPFGGGVAIGGDPGNPNNGTNVDAVSFGGFISSVAMFTNSLTVAQMENLFVAGANDGVLPPPVMITQPAISTFELIQGGSLTIKASGYGAQAGGYWTFNGNPVNTPDITGTNVTLVGTLLTGNLQITNFQTADVGTYQLVLTNAAGSAMSSTVAISIFMAQPGSYPVTATKTPGIIAMWPLNETGDPSTGTQLAYDIVGGYNGVYGVTAQDGGINSGLTAALNGAGLPAGDNRGAVPGPSTAGLVGLPATAFGSINNFANCLVTVAQGPSLSGVNSTNGVAGPVTTATPNSTNMTIVLWYQPLPILTATAGTYGNYPNSYDILFMECNGFLNAIGENGCQLDDTTTATAGQPGYDWDNNSSSTYGYTTGVAVSFSTWYFYALQISPSNGVVWQGSMQTGLLSTTNAFANINIPWGGGLQIGGCAAGYPSSAPADAGYANYFNGNISCATMFSNTLNVGQIVNLFDSGISGSTSMAPMITTQPSAAVEVISGGTVHLSSTAYIGTNVAGAYWQFLTNGNWVNLANVTNVISGATNGVTSGYNEVASLSVVLSPATAGSYRVIFTNGVGTGTTSVASTLSAYTAQPGSFAAAATTIPGLVALWPLNEQVDPSTGTAIAFDVIGGYNGTYGTNAQDGTNNAQLMSVLQGAGLPSSDYVSPVQGPGSAGLTGLPATAFAPSTGLLGSIITVPVGPAIPAGDTNASIILWINDSGQAENGGGNYTDLFMEVNGSMGAGGNNGAQLNLNGGAVGTLQMAYDWDNDNNSAHGWVTGAYVPINVWSMYALVISPSNAVLYLVNSSGFKALTNNFANIYIPWGAGFQIGGASAGSGGANNFFTGSISSAAFYTNSLNIQQISTLYAAGSALGNPPPQITGNPPFTNYVLLTNGSATITATAYAGPNGGGYWQMYSPGTGWTNLVAGGDHPSVSASVPSGSAMTVGTLVLTNVTGNDVGSYRCIFTNATSISVTSAPVVLQPLLSNPPANSFESIATTPSFGLAAYWPLNDNGDVTTNMVTYDVWGGWNGIYGTNASDGLYNILIGAGTAGPGSAGLLGFPSGDFSLGCNNLGINGYVKTAASPTMANTTNMTIVAWVQPTNATMPQNTALVVTRAAGMADGLAYGTGNSLESLWNGAYGDVGSGCQPTFGSWSMVAMVVTSSGTTFYSGTTNGVTAFPFAGANVYQSWGASLAIGGDPGTDPGDTFQGFMADVAIFTNALSAAQIGNLYYGGVAGGAVPPVISTQPVATEVYAGRPAVFTVVYSGFGNVTNQWQYKSGSTWINVVNGPGITGATNANLVIKNSSAAPGTSYRVVVGNAAGTVVSGTVTLTAAPAIGTYTYPQAVTNLNPVSYYRLNEAAGSLSAYDYWGGLTGTYGNYPDPVIPNQTDLAVTAGVPGVNNTQNGRLIDFSAAPGAFENNNTAAQFTNGVVESGISSGTALNSFITIPPLTTLSNGIVTNNMTITMWIWPREAQTDNAGLLYCRQGGTIAGLGFASAGNGWLGYNWGNNPATYTWTGNANLVPTVGAWNFVTLVITPTNATEYCYSKASQQVAVNSVTNAAQAWAGVAEIGNDPFDVTGARQFDGSIDEVAIFNQALSSAQVNQLWQTATGIPVPAQIVSAPVGQTNFMNLGANVSYTVNAVNGPLTYWWVLTNSQFKSHITLTNGANGFAGTLFSGATTGTLSISNWPAAFNINDTLIVNVTNTASPTIATTNWGIPALLPTYAVWTANFDFTNGGNWSAGTALHPTGYTNFGVVGLGTYWNPLISPGNVNETATTWTADTFTNQTAWDCTGTIQTGLGVSCNGQPYCDGTVPQQNALLETFLQSFSGFVSGSYTVPGFYNFIFYTSSGSFNNGGTISYGIHNYTNTDADVATYTSFVQGGNFMIMTNILLDNPSFTWSFTQSYTGNGFDAAGMQIQLIQPYAPLTYTNVGNTTTLYWSGGTLQATGNVTNSLWTNVTVNGVNATAPYVVPTAAANSAIFYSTPIITNSAAPGIPIH
jgi:hypothetical protein